MDIQRTMRKKPQQNLEYFQSMNIKSKSVQRFIHSMQQRRPRRMAMTLYNHIQRRLNIWQLDCNVKLYESQHNHRMLVITRLAHSIQLGHRVSRALFASIVP